MRERCRRGDVTMPPRGKKKSPFKKGKGKKSVRNSPEKTVGSSAEELAAKRAPEGVNPPEEPFPEPSGSTSSPASESDNKARDGEVAEMAGEAAGEQQNKGGKAPIKRQLAFERKASESSESDEASSTVEGPGSPPSSPPSPPKASDAAPAAQADKSTAPRASPKLQVLKARAAARRVIAKSEVGSRPSTAPAPVASVPASLPVVGRRRFSSSASGGQLTESDLRTQVDELEEALRDLGRERDEAAQESKGLAKKHREIEEATIKHYESIIENLESEVRQLGVRVKEAESMTLRQKILGAEDGAEVKLNEKEFAALRREIDEQETLLKGYQSENESAVLKLKQMKEEMREREEKMAEEQATYARDLIVLQEERRVDSQKTASWLREKLDLQRQTNALKEELLQSDAKHRKELERLKRENKELEARSAGVDLKQIEREEELLRSLKMEMEAMKREHQAARQELEGKLKWYSENQEFVDQNAELIKEQLDTIAELQKRLAKFEGDGSQDGPEARMAARIEELEQECKHLNSLLVKNNPDSLAALIQASKPTAEEQRQVKELSAEVEHQKKRNAELMRKHESQLRALRQQHERARAQDRQGEKRESSRAKELAKQVEDVRSHYGKKVKLLEKQLQGARREKTHYQESLREERRQSRLSESSQTAVDERAEAVIQALRIELEQAKEEREHLSVELRRTQDQVPARDDAVRILQAQVRDLEEKLGGMGRQPGPAPQALAAPHYAHRPAFASEHNPSPQSQHLGDRVRQLEAELAYLRSAPQVGQAKLQHRNSSYAPEYVVLEEKLAQMDARQMAREEQWRAVMEETKQLASLQQNVLNQKWELAIRAKNAEIDRFRSELDAILFDVSNLQRKGRA